MSVPFTVIGRGANLSQTRFCAGFGFMVDPDKNGTGTKVRIHEGWMIDYQVRPVYLLDVASKDFTIADGDFVYVHMHIYTGGGG